MIGLLALGTTLSLSSCGGESGEGTQSGNDTTSVDTTAHTDHHEHDHAPTVLHEGNIGELGLSAGGAVDAAGLSAAFPGHEVTQAIGSQDGPDFTMYTVAKEGKECFMMKMMDDDSTKMEQVRISTDAVKDEHGIGVGMSYADLKAKRPEAAIHTDEHFHTHVTVPGSNICYEISGETDGPDRTDYTEDEVQEWTVTGIMWMPGAGE